MQVGVGTVDSTESSWKLLSQEPTREAKTTKLVPPQCPYDVDVLRVTLKPYRRILK